MCVRRVSYIEERERATVHRIHLHTHTSCAGVRVPGCFIASTAFSSDDAPWWLKAAGIPDDVLESIGELINKTLANQSHTADTLVVKEDCWYACGERSGACPDFCGALIEVVSYSGARRELSTSPCPSAAGNESACCQA